MRATDSGRIEQLLVERLKNIVAEWSILDVCKNLSYTYVFPLLEITVVIEISK